MEQLFDNWTWQPPEHWAKITTIDMHAGGEPLRVYISGLPPIEGRTVLEKRRYFREHYDHIRKGTMCGHAIIALTKLVLETGLIRREGNNPQITINVPAGTVHAQAVMERGNVREVSFRN